MSEDRNKVAVITGAGSGIGRAAALKLAEAGYALVLSGRTESTLDETATQLGDATYIVHPADVTVPRQCDGLIAAANDRFGRLDVLANIAGYVRMASLPDTDPDTWQTTLATNVSAVHYLTRAAWPIFAMHKTGLIVNISSMASIDPFPGLGAYAAAKAAVNMLTKVTADEGEAIGLRSVAIAPGAVETDMLRSLFSTSDLPADATLDPADVAELIRDCCTGRREFESGQVIRIEP